MTKIIFEVGANNGVHVVEYLKDPDNIVYAVEPTPHHVQEMWERYKHEPRFHLIPGVIDIKNGFNKFMISPSSGCNSIHEFSDDILEQWPGHNELVHIDHYSNVMSFRLDTLMEMWNLDRIDYLEIDTQGNDFNVLKSLGERIHDVKEGHCEAYHNVTLYKSDNDLDNIRNYLESYGFKVSITPYENLAECEVKFTR
jgi:FkbM family methyltransferase